MGLLLSIAEYRRGVTPSKETHWFLGNWVSRSHSCLQLKIYGIIWAQVRNNPENIKPTTDKRIRHSIQTRYILLQLLIKERSCSSVFVLQATYQRSNSAPNLLVWLTMERNSNAENVDSKFIVWYVANPSLIPVTFRAVGPFGSLDVGTC